MRKIRILIVEDSLTVRKRLVEVLSAEPEFEIVAEASDGKTAIELCQRLRPDLVTMDMVLPVISGLAATEYLMAYCPTPILIVSGSSNHGEVFNTYDALAAGAVDVLEKPKGGEQDRAWEQELVAKARLVSHIKVITHIRPRLKSSVPISRPATEARHKSEGGYRVVAIGTSTGGPAACLQILRSLPASFPLPILLVLHIGPEFGGFLAQWLDGQSQLRVGYALDGTVLPASPPGCVLMAPPDRHLVVHDGRLRLTRDPERHSCRPSIDVLFESLAVNLGPETIGCLLSGMGKDGAQGLLAIRQAGGRTLVQDEATSAVFGMPQEAIRLGAADDVLALSEFAPALVALTANAYERSV